MLPRCVNIDSIYEAGRSCTLNASPVIYSLVSRPSSSMRKGSGETSLNSWACGSVKSFSVGLYVGQRWIMNLITTLTTEVVVLTSAQ